MFVVRMASEGKTGKWDLQFLFGFINFAAQTRAIIN